MLQDIYIIIYIYIYFFLGGGGYQIGHCEQFLKLTLQPLALCITTFGLGNAV